MNEIGMQRLHPLVYGGIVLLLAFPSYGTAQTLTEKLTNEDPARIAEDARQKGNVVQRDIRGEAERESGAKGESDVPR